MSEEGEDLCAAETEHEEEGGEDVDPEVDHNDLIYLSFIHLFIYQFIYSFYIF